MTYNTFAIRELLRVIFDDQELVIFCYDHFRPVYDKFASETSRLWKIQLLIDYCERYDQFDRLLTRVRGINPQQYARFIPEIKKPSQIPNIGVNAGKSQVEITLKGDLSNFTSELLVAVVGALAGVLNTPRDQISVLQTRGGSVILWLEMPVESVNQLIALYEGKNPLIQDLGIQQVRIIHLKREGVMTIPLRIDRYEIIEELGKGGMGRVYKARDPHLGGREVALKTIILPGTRADETLHDRFKKEVAAAGRLNHDHIVTIYNVKFEHDPPYMVMELLNGGTLRWHLDQAKGPLPWKETLTLLRPIVLALDYAHKAGVIHRDIKPENMMFKFETSPGRGQVLKLVDFGLAHWDDGPALTQRGAVMGTPRYMSPEQARGEEDVDAKTDIFALGVILFEALSGFNPLERGNTMATLREAGSDQPLDLKPLAGKVPPEVLDLVKQALARDPEQRYQTCERLLLDWDSCLNSATTDKTIISSTPPPVASPAGISPPEPPDKLPPITVTPEGDKDDEDKSDHPNIIDAITEDDQDELDHPEIINATGHDIPDDDLKIFKHMFAHWERVPDRVIVEKKFHAGFMSRVYLAKLIRNRVSQYLVVKIAPVGSIEKEWAVYHDCVKDFFVRIAVIRGQPVYLKGKLWGGLCYELEGGGTFPFESLLAFCQRPETKVDDILFVLNEQLFKIIETVGKQGQLDPGFLMHNSYDRLLPVNWEIKPTPPPSGARVLPIRKTAPSVSIRQGDYVSLEKFVVTEVNRERNEVTLNLPAPNYNPCADDPPNSYRVRLKEVQTIEDFQENNIAPPIIGVVTANRADLLQRWAQRAGINGDLTATRLPLRNQVSLVNPILVLPELLHPHTVKVGLVHGDLNVENILIELPARTVGLIDFADARRDHVLHDLLRLETGLLTRWLPELLRQTGQLSPEKIYDFLAKVDQKLRYPGHRIDPPRGLEKPFAALVAIRQAALDHFLVKQEKDRWSEYYRGLTLYLLGALKFKNLDDVPQAKLVAFWAAATACKFIAEPPDGKIGGGRGIRIKTVISVVLPVVLVGAAIWLWHFYSTFIVIDEFQVELDGQITKGDFQQVTCGVPHQLEVKLFKADGVQIGPELFTYDWVFNPPDSANKDILDSGNFAINYQAPCELNYQTVSIEVNKTQQSDKPGSTISVNFNISK